MQVEEAVKELCEKIAQENDAQKAAEMVASLRALIEMENDETRLRIRQILLHYQKIIPSLVVVSDKPPNLIGSFLAGMVSGKRVFPHDRNE